MSLIHVPKFLSVANNSLRLVSNRLGSRHLSSASSRAPQSIQPSSAPSVRFHTNILSEHPASYFDYQATTPLDPRVFAEMIPFMTTKFGNPHSRTHIYGWESEAALTHARGQVASLINAKAHRLIENAGIAMEGAESAKNDLWSNIIFTSGATESNNIAVKGIVTQQFSKLEPGEKLHIITTSIEHKCILGSFRDLETDFPDKVEVTYLPVGTDGLVDPDTLKNAIKPNTIFVSIIHTHNEIGVVQDLKTLVRVAKEANKNIIFHSDLAQSFGKVPIDVQDMNLDLASISGHKIYGPKGIGALYVNTHRRPRIRIKPVFSGGGQERNIRSGTVPTFLAVGLGAAAEIASKSMDEDNQRIKAFADQIWSKLSQGLPDIVLNGHPTKRYHGNLNISFDSVEGESLIMALKDVAAVSSGSACTSATLEPSYVLRAIGVGDDLAHTSLRFGLGRFTTQDDVDRLISSVVTAVEKLRAMSPMWEMKLSGAKVAWT